jgi:hypothetical protein
MPTRYAPPNARERHAELRRLVDAATSRLMAAPELEELSSLPRTEKALRRAWSSWDVSARRVWLRRLVERIEVKPAGPARGPRTDVESRMAPVWKI